MVASNTSVQLEVVEPWDVVPDATSVYQLGGVDWSWRSGWLEFADDPQTNLRYLGLVFRPMTTPTTLDIELYYDHSETPRDWAFDQDRDGVTTITDDPHIAVDLRTHPVQQGQITYQMSGHSNANSYGDTYVSLRLSGVQGAEAIRVYQVNISGVNPTGGDS